LLKTSGGADGPEELDDPVVIAADRDAQADTAQPPLFSAASPSVLPIVTPDFFKTT
jgi:hypothetical protein